MKEILDLYLQANVMTGSDACDVLMWVSKSVSCQKSDSKLELPKFYELMKRLVRIPISDSFHSEDWHQISKCYFDILNFVEKNDRQVLLSDFIEEVNNHNLKADIFVSLLHESPTIIELLVNLAPKSFNYFLLNSSQKNKNYAFELLCKCTQESMETLVNLSPDLRPNLLNVAVINKSLPVIEYLLKSSKDSCWWVEFGIELSSSIIRSLLGIFYFFTFLYWFLNL